MATLEIIEDEIQQVLILLYSIQNQLKLSQIYKDLHENENKRIKLEEIKFALNQSNNKINEEIELEIKLITSKIQILQNIDTIASDFIRKLDDYICEFQPYMHPVDLNYNKSVLDQLSPFKSSLKLLACHNKLSEIFLMMNNEQQVLLLNSQFNLRGSKKVNILSDNNWGSKENPNLKFVIEYIMKKENKWLSVKILNYYKIEKNSWRPIELLKYYVKYTNNNRITLEYIRELRPINTI